MDFIKNAAVIDRGERAEVPYFAEIGGRDIDSLVSRGVKHILENGERVAVRAGTAWQAYGVNYVLENPLDRLHLSRSGAVRYLCREFLAYFNGSLKVDDGLCRAAPFWSTLQDENGAINSNYGYYVFYEPVEKYGNQYNWVVERLVENIDTRRATININQTYHKTETLDFPCTLAIQFFKRNGALVCEVSARSTDVVTGLPFDMGFFSFLHELVFRDIVERGVANLRLGPTIIKASFTQIYDRTYDKAMLASKHGQEMTGLRMPAIASAKEMLADIYNGSAKTAVSEWIARHAE
jgi:thymidylate synthase